MNKKKFVNELKDTPIIIISDGNVVEIFDELTEFENNIFFALISLRKSQKSQMIKFFSEDMRKLINYRHNIGKQDFAEKIEKALKKILQIKISIKDKGKYMCYINMIDSVAYYTDDLEFNVFVNDEFNNLSIKFDWWNKTTLKQYSSIHSKYSKKLYLILKQSRNGGYLQLTYREFGELIGFPESYKTWHVYQRIIRPALKDLTPYFKNLKCIRNYDSRYGKRGRFLSSYTFSWDKNA